MTRFLPTSPERAADHVESLIANLPADLIQGAVAADLPRIMLRAAQGWLNGSFRAFRCIDGLTPAPVAQSYRNRAMLRLWNARCTRIALPTSAGPGRLPR